MNHSLSSLLTSRRGAWAVLAIALVLMVALFGLLRGADAPARSTHAPVDSESARVSALLEQFPDADRQSVLVVASRTDGGPLGADDLQALDGLLPTLGEHTAAEPSGPVVSEDGQAALLIAPITVGTDNSETAQTIDALRTTLADHAIEGVSLQVTGGPAFGADIASAFDGADFTLLAVTILIVAALLILTYRSPVLWLVPLMVIVLADGLAGRVTAAVGAHWGLQFDAGIISVLVFGAGTNYALLLTSRYREELHTEADHRVALARAWRGVAPAVVASNATVVLALLTLLLATIPLTRGLAIPAAIGLLIAMAAVLLVLPPLLAVCGRRVFWPFVPQVDGGGHRSRAVAWRTVAGAVVRRPVIALAASLALLGVMATGLLGTTVGLDQAERFRVESESAEGLEVLSEHFPPGEAAPIIVVTAPGSVEQVAEAAQGVDGVVRAHPLAAMEDGSLASVMVTGEYTPGTEQSLDQVRELRTAVHAIDEADALVGGSVASDLDAREGNRADLLLVAPLILAVTFAVLLVLLRSAVAPVLLLMVNLASTVAAIGAGAWLSRMLLEQQALDPQVPILAFLFLVALGIDYTIFLVHRARSEAATWGTRRGMVEAVTHTGGVITSAGVVLAAVFAALGVLPLVTLAQLGLVVGVGVVVDTLVVRTVMVPAIFSLVGERIWWPGGPSAAPSPGAPDLPDSAESDHEPYPVAPARA
ncbi:MMPL family transporter [Brachybacterium muris]|uniref:MMPL family transporter n=1 Tax=Brachybacterium muris TaxID=219301 RepID=UPI0021A759C8|nr:MMPL family transporter [Brachybacterium muris]MCT1429585.1 MMPL family transporter [Brachybacterium muris]